MECRVNDLEIEAESNQEVWGFVDISEQFVSRLPIRYLDKVDTIITNPEDDDYDYHEITQSGEGFEPTDEDIRALVEKFVATIPAEDVEGYANVVCGYRHPPRDAMKMPGVLLAVYPVTVRNSDVYE